MPITNPTTIPSPEYQQIITDILVKHICSPQFQQLEPDVRELQCNAVWKCYFQVWT